eukprot:EG_transcript_19185
MPPGWLLRLLLACGIAIVAVRQFYGPGPRRPTPKTCKEPAGGKPIPGPLMTCTRIHRKEAARADGQDIEALRRLLGQAQRYSDFIAVAVDEADAALMREVAAMVEDVRTGPAAPAVPIAVLPVSMWGNFVMALNSLLLHAGQVGAAVILFTSVELEMTVTQVKALRQHLLEDTLVVGAKVPGQDFSVGRHTLTGGNSPWNTFALWSVPKLLQIGFMSLSEGLLKGVPGGVEEGPVIALLQVLHPEVSCCKLVELEPPPKWHTDWTDPGRLAWHRRKMESKVQRTAAQLKAANLPAPFVDHIRHVI